MTPLQFIVPFPRSTHLSFFGLPVSFGGAFGFGAGFVAVVDVVCVGVFGCGEFAAGGFVTVGVVVVGVVVVAVVDVDDVVVVGGAQSPFVVTDVRNDVSPRVTVTFVTPTVLPGIVAGLTLSAA